MNPKFRTAFAAFSLLLCLFAFAATTSAQDGTYDLVEYQGAFGKCVDSSMVGLFPNGRGAAFSFKMHGGVAEKGAAWDKIQFRESAFNRITLNGSNLIISLTAAKKADAERCRPKR